MFIKNYFEEKRKKELIEAYQKIIENAYKKHIPEKHMINKYACLHVLSKSEAEVNIEKIFNIIKSNVVIKSGTIDYTTKSDVNDILFKLKSEIYVNVQNDKAIVFNNRKLNEGDQKSNKPKNNFSAFNASNLVKQIKDKEFTPSNLFIYVVEKGKIYDGYEFISEYLPNSKDITLFYKGSINYKDSRSDDLHKTKTEIC